MLRYLGYLLLVASIHFQAMAQIGGKNTYDFLDLSPSARLEALGGVLTPLKDPDVNMVLNNPCILDSSILDHMGFNSVIYPGGINHGLVSIVKSNRRLGLIGMHIQYVNYGRFQRADASGEKMGNFYGAESAIALSWATKIDKIRLGLNFKLITSFLEQYSSVGIAGDLYAMYINPLEDFFLLGSIKNIGSQIKPYNIGNKEPLPFDLQISIGQKLEHVPITLIGTFHNLHQWDIRYNNPADQTTSLLLSDTSSQEKSYLFDKAMRHFVFGMEFNLSNNLDFRLGYNYLRRHELLVESRRSTIGFSWGVSFKVKKFKFDYARSKYHISGTTNNISMTLNIQDFKQKGPLSD